MSVLGVIMAGGRNTRYGDHKALAPVGGIRILDRVRAALAAVTPAIVLVANDPEAYAGSGLEQRPDVRPGTGVLGGILTALEWARERGYRGALVVACDMPFVPPSLLAELNARAEGSAAAAGESADPDEATPASAGDPTTAAPAAAAGESADPDEATPASARDPTSAVRATAASPPDIVAAESGGRRGIEPLCAWYATSCIPAVERALARGDRRVVSFFDELRVERIPLARIRRHGEPEVLFMNVNTPEERERAERIAAAGAAGPTGTVGPTSAAATRANAEAQP